jgi:hypothetical protein
MKDHRTLEMMESHKKKNGYQGRRVGWRARSNSNIERRQADKMYLSISLEKHVCVVVK